MEPIIGTDLNFAKTLLEEGKLVAIPTETVYGLAGNGFSAEAVSEIFRVKNRPFFDPLILHIADRSKLESLVTVLPWQAHLLAEAFWPGPLTLLLQRQPQIPDLVTSGLPRVAVRVPQHPLAQALLSTLNFPLAAPSANPFGYISPTTALHVAKQLGTQIPYILDGGPCQVGIESTIVGFHEDGKPVVYRKGGIGLEDLEQVVGKVEVMARSSSRPGAPGMLDQHYAPRKPLLLGHIPDLLAQYSGKPVAVLSFQEEYLLENPEIVASKVLSSRGDVQEAARNLFGAMRALDESEGVCILAEKVPEKGLGLAINDRLQRASALI
jgi:L-threonylcarbamoyladenylate synthase